MADLYEPWVVPTAFPLTVLQLRQIGLQIRSDQAAGMGIIPTVQHDHWLIDCPE